MQLVIVKKKDKIQVFKDNDLIKFKNEYCFINGKIYNLDDLDNLKGTDEEKLLKLYTKYGNDLFYKLNGDFSAAIIKDGNILLFKDRVGTKQWYYKESDDEFICSNSLKSIIDKYKDKLKIDIQVLSNYFAYSYIAAPKTIFESVYKLEAGSYLIYNNKIKKELYYDLDSEYIKNKNSIRNYKEAEKKLEEVLINAIEKRTKNCNKIGVFFSSGVDSTLIVALLRKLNKEVHTYTVGFLEKERNEATEASTNSKYFKTIHHEFYISHEDIKETTSNLFKVYSEPFSDPSMIPILFLNKKLDKDVDVLLTGDGADQLFLGSAVYDSFLFIRYIIRFFKRKRIRSLYWKLKNATLSFINVTPEIYPGKPNIRAKAQIKYMLFDIKTFLSNRLFIKVGLPSDYYSYFIAHPFVDNECVTLALGMKNSFKYHNKNKKYILKKILYKYKKDFKRKKLGFGIPLKKYLKNIYLDDIIKYSNKEVLEKQGIFDYKMIHQQISKLKNNEIKKGECYVMFSYYMFQLWYKEYVNDLWG